MTGRMNRRSFIKVTGSAAAVGTTGLAGILASGRAPAYAQGTKLHIVRWVDFIPEADVELKRQAPEASKALGAEVTFEFINANDLQPRITAAVQSGSGADIIQMLWNWPHLYANALVDVSDVAERRGQGAGRLLRGLQRLREGRREVAGRPPRRWSATPSPTASRGTRRSASPSSPRPWTTWREVGQKLKAKGQAGGPGPRPQLRRPAHLVLSPALDLRGRRGRPDGEEGHHQLEGHHRRRQVHAGLLEGRLRRGRPGLGRHQQQPGLPRRRALRHAQRRVDLHRRQAPAGQAQGRQGRAPLPGHRPRGAPARRGRPGRPRSTSHSSTAS